MLDDPVHLALRAVTDPWDGNWFLNGLDFFFFFLCEKLVKWVPGSEHVEYKHS